MGTMIRALLFEGFAHDKAQARAMVERSEINFDSAYQHASVSSMAGVISRSMAVYILENKTHGNRADSNLNEGYGTVLRYGAYGQEVPSPKTSSAVIIAAKTSHPRA
jgi:hypothetical protein